MNKPERLDLETADITNENIAKIGALFPNCLTEAKDENGRTVAAIDFDKLRQELSHDIVEGADERYRFDWPEKRKATILANTPTRMTLRPCREESVDFDTTQNLYIEGDNLEVLKLLRETYFGKVKMIYIDPPYNTGKDSFVYSDDYRGNVEDFASESDAIDDEGNKMFDIRQNNESNGRFHTDWLNMMYPRLKVAKDLLTDDGAIFISIDDHEVTNLKRVCDELFGECNFIAQAVVKRSTNGMGDKKGFAQNHDYVLCYQKSESTGFRGLTPDSEYVAEFCKEDEHGRYKIDGILMKKGTGSRREDSPTLYFPLYYSPVTGEVSLELKEGFKERYPIKANGTEGRWTWGRDKIMSEAYRLYASPNGTIYIKDYLTSNRRMKIKSILDDKRFLTDRASNEIVEVFGRKVFDTPKPIALMCQLIDMCADSDDIIFDFFSGSATTAHAVMKLNVESGTQRKFVMVQLQENCPDNSEAAKMGFKNICEIGKERIRRAGKKILEEWNETLVVDNPNAKVKDEELLFPEPDIKFEGDVPVIVSGAHMANTQPCPDVGFRVLKLDTSNMEEVYYSPKVFADKVMQGTLNLDGDASLAENIKQGRTGEDLLFQSMLRLDVPLSAKIETEEIHGKRVFVVDDGYMMATFDKDVNEEAIKAIAKRTPSIFVMCDGGFATDNVADNFEQIWKAFSPDTVRRVI